VEKIRLLTNVVSVSVSETGKKCTEKKETHTHAIIMHKQMFVSLLFAQRTIQSAMRKKRAKNKIDLEGKYKNVKKSKKKVTLQKPLSQEFDFTG